MNMLTPPGRKKITLLLLLNLFLSLVYGQSNLPVITQPSPNAASLGAYGQIPVSLFSGLPQITIPLGSVNAGDISVPISLNYHGGGVMPEHHPGWVGLGWDLNAGGAITRIVNGGIDEVLIDQLSPITMDAYYYNYADAAFSTWASIDTLQYYINTPNPHAYPAPDEFTFNFGGYSGSFFLNQYGQWQVRSADPITLQVHEQLMSNYTLPAQTNGISSIILKSIFYQFTLTTPDGTKYIFGGTPESIEFTRNSPSVDPSDDYNSEVIPTTWFLTSIISIKGNQINLTYARDGVQAIMNTSISLYQYLETGIASQRHSDTSEYSLNVINPSYLTQIKGPDQTVNFARSTTSELAYPYNKFAVTGNLYRDLGEENSITDLTGDIKWLKLDSISFYTDEAGFLKKFTFGYYNQSTSRLRLDSLQEQGTGGINLPPYKFAYNSSPLPPYLSKQLDHWGYYNGTDYFTTHPKTPSAYDSSDVHTYFQARTFNASLMQAGSLAGIKYPTGGTTTFTYEPHDFSKIAQRYPFTVTDTTPNTQCGGIRIKQITNTDADGNITSQKQYLYVKGINTGGTVSSGILDGVPTYLDYNTWTFAAGKTLSYWFWYDYPVLPLSFTNGNHVTYSEVVEKLADGSYAVNTFSNHDVQTYQDQPEVAGIYSAPNLWSFDPDISRALDRGKLLTRSDYNASNVLLKKAKYNYDTSASRYNEAVRTMKVTTRTFNDVIDGRVTAFLNYTFPQYLVGETDSTWDQNGANPVVTLKNTVFNTSYRLKIADSTFNSKGQCEKLTYQYSFDLLHGSDSAIYIKMTDSNLLVPIIIQRKFLDARQVSYTKANYYAPFTGIYVPQTVDMQTAANPVETRLQFLNYDTAGNILTDAKSNGQHISYIWAYRRLFPIAEIRNADQTDVAYSSFETPETGNWVLSGGTTLNTGGITGSHAYELSSGNSISRTGLNSARKYLVSYWSTNGALSIGGTTAVSGPNRNGWTYYEHTLATGSTSVTITGAGIILDELRLYPTDAQMTTYTFSPQIGMTSQCDVNNRVIYYQYDGLQRLKVVKDQDGNIIKTIDYHYKGQ